MNNKQEKIEFLKGVLRRTKYKIVICQKSVSRSGMSRRLEVYSAGLSLYLTPIIADVLDLSYNDKGLNIIGCGMDMHFALCENLTWKLYGKKKPKSLKGNGGGCIDWKSI